MTSQSSFLGVLFRKRSTRAKLGPKCAGRMIAVLIKRRGWVTRA